MLDYVVECWKEAVQIAPTSSKKSRSKCWHHMKPCANTCLCTKTSYSFTLLDMVSSVCLDITVTVSKGSSVLICSKIFKKRRYQTTTRVIDYNGLHSRLKMGGLMAYRIIRFLGYLYGLEKFWAFLKYYKVGLIHGVKLCWFNRLERGGRSSVTGHGMLYFNTHLFAQN